LSFLRNQLNSRNFSYSRMFGASVDFDALYTGNNVATLNITQNLSKSAERALALDVYGSYQWDRAIEGPLTTSSEQDTRDPWGGSSSSRWTSSSTSTTPARPAAGAELPAQRGPAVAL
jgi:hypothetical protein